MGITIYCRIDVRSKCTRNLLKIGNAEQEENISPNVNGSEGNNKRASESQGEISRVCAINL